MPKRIAFIVALLVTVAAAAASAQSTVLLVRHAERADAGRGGTGSDPELSAAGLARAESLAVALKDAGITAIFATEFKRTQQTAAPLAKSLGLMVTIVPAKDLAGLVEKIGKSPGNVLVVGHSNTVPGVIKTLGVTATVEIADAEYDNLFVISTGAKPSMLRLHYR
jgi:broad specificity phosphatase PhoE